MIRCVGDRAWGTCPLKKNWLAGLVRHSLNLVERHGIVAPVVEAGVGLVQPFAFVLRATTTSQHPAKL